MSIHELLKMGIIKGNSNSPIAQRTKLGWIISGPVNSSSNVKQVYHISIDKELHDLLQRFWKLEEISSLSTSSLSVDEQECDQHYKQTHSRDIQGRYTGWPT